MEDPNIIRKISFIKRSKNRLKLISIIDDSFKTPTDIATVMDLRVNQISAILSDLKKENIVVCINKKEKTGRLYQLTPEGKEAYNMIKTNQ